MAAAAAFFDLDRTLLRGASGPVLTEALVAAGIVSDHQIPGIGLLYKAYEAFGESLFGIYLARQAVNYSTGWVRAAVREASEEAARSLAEVVAPFARPLIEEHRRAGRAVVLTTTTPHDLVCPLAERLGFDDVVATRYAEAGGVYTGGIEGEFVWGPGKLVAVRRWAVEHDVAMGESWAYSDSVFDYPLLSAVGHPHAVNPDPRLLLVAMLRRWPVRHLDVPRGVPKLAGLEPFDLLRPLLRPEAFPYARFEIDGTDRLPATGPAIVACNHRSYFDFVVVALAIAGAGRAVRFLGNAEVFDAPVVGTLARAMGGIRVGRGSRSADPLRQAADALEAGELVALMPEGTIPRGRDFFAPDPQGRPIVAPLAAMTRAPVIPLGLWGTEAVWPRSSRVPRVLNLTHPPHVSARVGPPVDLSYDDVGEDTRRIMAAIADLIPPDARRDRRGDRPPTAEQLAATFPPGTTPPALGPDGPE